MQVGEHLVRWIRAHVEDVTDSDVVERDNCREGQGAVQDGDKRDAALE